MAASATSFRPGQSGNPAGKPKLRLADGRTINELCREHTQEAIETLIAVASDDTAPPAARVSASIAILDRGWGRPKQTIETEGSIDLAAALAAGNARVASLAEDSRLRAD